MFTALRISLISFLETNYIKIIVALVLTFILYLIFYLSTKSLKKLKIEVFSSYPFGLFFPQGGTWSIGYFLIVILLLGLLVFFGFEGKLFLGPA